MKALDIPVLEHDRTSVIGRKALPSPPSISSLMSPEKVTKVEKIIGHTFQYPYYLAQVLVYLLLPDGPSTSLTAVSRQRPLYPALKARVAKDLNFLAMRY
jgi:hypothetical protein